MKRLFDRLRLTETDVSVQNGLSFQPKADDVFVTTFPKCGTTWVSMILHSLRSNGNMDFSEITEVVPWEICAHDCGINLDDEQAFTPRLFKSHEAYKTVPKGAKYVYVARNPLEVVVSFYEFLLCVANLTTDDVQFSEWFYEFYVKREVKIWDHYLSFMQQRDNPNVLWVFYEDLLSDREKCIVKIAEFANIPLSEELKATVMHQSSFEFMKAHDTKFDDHFLLTFAYRRINQSLPESEQIDMSNAKANKVHKGGGKQARITLPVEMIELMDKLWTEIIGSATGIENYAQLRQQYSFIGKM